MIEPRPKAVLFACTLNRVRSPMAAALAQRLSIVAESCGLRAPEEVDPFMVAAMGEIGLDLSTHKPRRFEALEDGGFDLVISLTPEAQHRAVELGRLRGVEVEYWPMPDPTLVEGTREQRLDAYRELRDALEARLVERFGRPSTFGG